MERLQTKPLSSKLTGQQFNRIRQGFPKPVYYEQQDCILLSTFTRDFNKLSDTDSGIYSFSLKDKYEWELLTNYPKGLELKYHNMCLDTDNHQIYVFGGEYNSFAIYNIQTKEWYVKVHSSKKNKIAAEKHQTFELEESVSLYLPSPIKEFHIFTEDDHIKYDKDEEKFIDLIELPVIHQSTNKYREKSKFIYSQSLNTIFVFRGRASKWGDKISIFCWDMNKKKSSWEIFPMKLPDINGDYGVILAFDHIVFVLPDLIRWDPAGIICLDLKYKKLYKVNILIPECMQEDTLMINCNNEEIHLLNENCSYKDKDSKFHHTFSLRKLIPDKLAKDYKEAVGDLLVIGYTNRMEKKLKIPNVPQYLAKIILSYFHFF